MTEAQVRKAIKVLQKHKVQPIQAWLLSTTRGKHFVAEESNSGLVFAKFLTKSEKKKFLSKLK